MITELNIKTMPPERGEKRPPLITITKHLTQNTIRFNQAAARLLGLKVGDTVSFQLKDGILRLIFDPKNGFEIKISKYGKTWNNYTIHNKCLAEQLVKIKGRKMLIGEFSQGGYVITAM